MSDNCSTRSGPTLFAIVRIEVLLLIDRRHQVFIVSVRFISKNNRALSAVYVGEQSAPSVILIYYRFVRDFA
jgi:hypothetical protein